MDRKKVAAAAVATSACAAFASRSFVTPGPARISAQSLNHKSAQPSSTGTVGSTVGSTVGTAAVPALPVAAVAVAAARQRKGLRQQLDGTSRGCFVGWLGPCD
eukprot:Skav233874  [mRNA]  locus=scaffold1483:153011:155817:+ [translate_table: standard]